MKEQHVIQKAAIIHQQIMDTYVQVLFRLQSISEAGFFDRLLNTGI